MVNATMAEILHFGFLFGKAANMKNDRLFSSLFIIEFGEIWKNTQTHFVPAAQNASKWR